MMQDPVQHRSGKYRITHHLSPVNDLFVGGKDDGTGFIGVADKCEKTIRLSAADRSVANCNQRAQTDGFAEQNGRDAERADLTCRY